MDLQWRAARMWELIELGQRENLSFRELSRRFGVNERTLRRWNIAFREGRVIEMWSLEDQRDSVLHAETEVPAHRKAFVELVEPVVDKAGPIELELAGGRRLRVRGVVEVEALVRVITAAEQC